MQKAFAALAGPILAVWLFLLVISPLVAVFLMLAAMTWQNSGRRRAAVSGSASRVRLLHSHR